MMIKTRFIAIASLGAAAVLVAALLWPKQFDTGAESLTAKQQVSTQPQPATMQSSQYDRTTPATAAVQSGKAPRIPVAVSDSPEVQEFKKYEIFRERAEAFFDTAESWPTKRRNDEAVTLLKAVNWAETEDYVLPTEAMVLKLGILKLTIADEAQFQSLAEGLSRDYRQRAENRVNNRVPDPRHDVYQHNQSRIAAEVMSDSGLSEAERQTLLRRKLTALRTSVYGNNAQ